MGSRHPARSSMTASFAPASREGALPRDADRGGAPCPGARAGAHRCRLVCVRAPAGLCRVPPDRRPGGRVPDGGHGTFRKPSGTGAAPVPGPARARHDVHDATRPSPVRAAGIILSNDADIAGKINSAVFPGQQGGPLEHVIAGNAVAFKIAASDEFKEEGLLASCPQNHTAAEGLGGSTMLVTIPRHGRVAVAICPPFTRRKPRTVMEND